MKQRPITVDSNLRETAESVNGSFMLTCDEQHVADARISAIRHWHDVIQISYVTNGKVLFRSDGTEAVIEEGQALFINSGCLHEAHLLPGYPDSVYISVNFHASLVYGHSDSSIYLDYVYPVLHSAEIAFVPLIDRSGWQRDACELVGQIVSLERSQEFGYELGQKCAVDQIWQLLIQNNRETIDTVRRISFDNRVKVRKLVGFIQLNHTESLTLKDIADSIHISRSECCRLFKRVLNLTPFEFLIKQRVGQSLLYLTSTDLGMADIAQRVGFGSSSYFTECFKREMHQSPLKYRKTLLDRTGRDPKLV